MARPWTRTAAAWGVIDGWRLLMFCKWKCAEWVMLLMCEWKDGELSRMTPRLLT